MRLPVSSSLTEFKLQAQQLSEASSGTSVKRRGKVHVSSTPGLQVLRVNVVTVQTVGLAKCLWSSSTVLDIVVTYILANGKLMTFTVTSNNQKQ